MMEINPKTSMISILFSKLTKTFFILISGVALSLYSNIAMANNLVINNFAVYETDTATNSITFTCDVSWENSWRSLENYDAVWIFLKYSTDGGTTWSHASMGGSGVAPIGFNAPVGFEIVVPIDEKGFFLQRTDLSSGNVNAQSVRFIWDYSQDGLTDNIAMASNTITKVYGVEMVYIPEGSFYAGDGVSSSDYKFQQGTADNDPWYVQSENAITTTNSSSNGFYYQGSGAAGEDTSGSVFLIPTSFPKGFNDFYVMKYELTEGQWVSFFNSLSTAAKTNRDITSSVKGGKGSDSVVNRNTVAWDSSNVKSEATTTRPDRPVTYASWPDLLAYADWAGLRPITELEFEKMARGIDISPVANELAWGKTSTSINGALPNEITAFGTINPDVDEDGSEQIMDGGANINNNNLAWSSGDGRVGGDAEGQVGPLRAGIFAETSTARTTSGASYYGLMELSGNLYEMTVSVGKSEGRKFLGSHGDGKLVNLSGYEGNATNTDWPGLDPTDSARGITMTVGSGYRGGDFRSANVREFQVSTRINAAIDADSEGYFQRYDAAFGIFQGGRLGRTAP